MGDEWVVALVESLALIALAVSAVLFVAYIYYRYTRQKKAHTNASRTGGREPKRDEDRWSRRRKRRVHFE